MTSLGAVGRCSKVKSSSVLIAGNRAALIRILVPFAAREATWRPRTAARYSSWDQPCSRAWSPKVANVAAITGVLSSRDRNTTSPAMSLPASAVLIALPAGSDAPPAADRVGRRPRRNDSATAAQPRRRWERAGPVGAAQLGCGHDVGRVGDALMGRPASLVGGHQHPGAGHSHVVQAGVDINEPANHVRVDRVVVTGDPHMVVPAQPHPRRDADRRGHRRQRPHRRSILDYPYPGLLAGASQYPRVRPGQPPGQLGVVVVRGREGAPRHERGLQEPVGPLDQALWFPDPAVRPGRSGSPTSPRTTWLPPSTGGGSRSRTRCPTPTSWAPDPTPSAAATSPRPNPRSSARAAGPP